MPYKHPEDRRAWHRRHYRENKEQMKLQAADWYEEHKGDANYMDRKRNYMILFRRRKKSGL